MSKRINIKKKIIFLAYREWAKNIIINLKKKVLFRNAHYFKKQKEFDKFIKNKKNYLIILIGWSNILKKKIVNDNTCIGVHPSDLPDYKGGSPIQNQILNNIIKTKASLFKLNTRIDDGDIYGKINLNLEGDNFTQISKNIEKSSIKLIYNYLLKFPNNKKINIKKKNNKTHKRLMPSNSKISLEDFLKMNTIEIYNKIRCLTDPYPNAYLEDNKKNKIYFLEVVYKKK